RASTDAPVRERVVVLLGDVGARDALAPVRSTYEREQDAAVREAIVRAVGLLGDDGDVAWLVARAEQPSLVRAVAFALARVRTDAALAALRAIARRARESDPPDADTSRLADYLTTPAF